MILLLASRAGLCQDAAAVSPVTEPGVAGLDVEAGPAADPQPQLQARQRELVKYLRTVSQPSVTGVKPERSSPSIEGGQVERLLVIVTGSMFEWI